MSSSQEATRLKIVDAEERASKWLADGNDAAALGKTKKAEACYAKGQFWLDRANKLLRWN